MMAWYVEFHDRVRLCRFPTERTEQTATPKGVRARSTACINGERLDSRLTCFQMQIALKIILKKWFFFIVQDLRKKNPWLMFPSFSLMRKHLKCNSILAICPTTHCYVVTCGEAQQVKERGVSSFFFSSAGKESQNSRQGQTDRVQSCSVWYVMTFGEVSWLFTISCLFTLAINSTMLWDRF